MEIKYISKNYKISDKLKDIIEKKLSKLEKYFTKDTTVKVACTEQNDICKLEITINSAGLFIRSEVESDNMYNNIDLSMPKLERQIVKNTFLALILDKKREAKFTLAKIISIFQVLARNLKKSAKRVATLNFWELLNLKFM